MRRIIGSVVAAIVFAFATVATAQQPQPQAEGTLVVKQRVFQTQDGIPPPDTNVIFFASESFGGKVVKGAPYSAEAVTETIQTLSDGNRIINKFTSTLYRDNEGRTRREQTLKGLGPLGASEQALQTIFINDPVAGVTYSLDSRTHTAHKTSSFKFDFKLGSGGATGGGNLIMTAPLGATPDAARLPHAGVEEFTLRTEGAAATYVFRSGKGPNANEKKEELGKQIIEGVEAEGTRTTITIPAGEIGNERPIEIVSERWYSPELQMLVMTRHSDPRMGETTYKLTNINRAEPAKSLFEVPSDYTIRSGLQFGPGFPARSRKPE